MGRPLPVPARLVPARLLAVPRRVARATRDSLRRDEASAARAAGEQVAVDRRAATAADRTLAALAVVAEAERLEPALPTATGEVDLWARDRVIRRPEVPAAVAGLIPSQQRGGWAPDAPRVRHVSAPVAADLVVMAKFDVNDRIKLRAAYAEQRLTLAVQPPSPRAGDGIARALEAHAIVPRHAPTLMPPLVGHGQLADGLPYLVETWLEGESLLTGVRLAEAVPEILAGLSAVHRGHGLTPVRASEQWPLLAGRWEETVAVGIVPEDLAAWVGQLLARDGSLRRSWVHGDLVASNAMRTSDGITLIDWEHAREAPIMTDAAKLHLFSADPDGTLAHVLEGFGGPGGSSSPAEELALAHANLISNYPRRSATLVGHPRAAVYDKQVRRQVERLAQVRATTA